MERPPEPPGRRKRPTSFVEASNGADTTQHAEMPEQRRHSLSHAEAVKQKHRMSSPEPPAPPAVVAPAPVPSPAWPSLMISPDQSKPKISDGEADSSPRPNSDANEVPEAANKIVSPTPSSQSKQVMSYADIARKNIPAPKKAAGKPPATAKEQVKPADAPAPGQPTHRASNTPELLQAIEKVVKSAEARRKPAVPKPADVPEQERRPREKLPEAPRNMAQQTAKPKASPKKDRPLAPLTRAGVTRGQKNQKNQPLTWAGVVKGEKAVALLRTSPAKPPVPQFPPATPCHPPATPLIPHVTPRSGCHSSPTQSSTYLSEHRQTPPHARTTENSRPKTPGAQETGALPDSPASASSRVSRHSSQPPSQQLEMAVLRTKLGEEKAMAEASPSAKSNLSSSDVERHHKFATSTDRRVPVLAGNLAATLKKHQKEELVKQQEEGLEKQRQERLVSQRELHPVPVNPLPLAAAWPSHGSQIPFSVQTHEQNSSRQLAQNFVPGTFPPLDTAWAALPSQAAVDYDPNLNMPSYEANGAVDRVPTQPGPSEGDIQAAVNDEEAKKERERSAMRRGIPKTNANLWQFQFGWDVLVRCDATTWRVHRQILAAKSPWFAQRLPPQDATRPYVDFNCAGHNVNDLGHALWFMYHGFYPGSTLRDHDPLDGDCICRNIYMYLCGASVDCGAMTTFAVNAMHGITSTMSTLMPAIYKLPGLHRLYNPLRQGLELLHSQGNRQNMLAMRVAAARLVDVTLLYFMQDPGFSRLAFQPEWWREIYPMCFWDSVLFRRMGLIGECEVGAEAGVADGEESDEGTVVLDVVSGEAEDDDDATPRAEKKREDSEPTAEVMSRHGGEQELRGPEKDEEGAEVDTPSRTTTAEKEIPKRTASQGSEAVVQGEPNPSPEGAWCLSISK